MKAEIVKVNYNRGFAIFLLEDGEYGWFEILDSEEVNPEDVVYGNFTELDSTTIKKETGETVDIIIQDFCSIQVAMKMVFQM